MDDDISGDLYMVCFHFSSESNRKERMPPSFASRSIRSFDSFSGFLRSLEEPEIASGSRERSQWKTRSGKKEERGDASFDLAHSLFTVPPDQEAASKRSGNEEVTQEY